MKPCVWKGVLYAFLWYTSILCGFYILCSPMLPLLLINHKAYRHIMDLIFATWELYPVALMELLFGTEFIVSGDAILPWERSILVMNHRTRLDWNFLWAAMHYATLPPAHRLKFVLKAPIRHVPGPGWVMQMAGFLYIHRNWEQDQKLLVSILEYLRDLEHTYQVLIFPEGTDYTPESIAKSNKFADKNNLPHYTKVLHPKTTGFSFLANRMLSDGQLDAVYDLTVGYPESLPETEIDVTKGIFPEQVHFHITRYSVKDLPTHEDGLKTWLSSLWKEKEDTLIDFYNKKSFTTDKKITKWPRPITQIWVSFFSLLFIFMSFTSEGLQHIEVAWFRLKKARQLKKEN